MLPGADAPYAAISARYAATPSAGDTPPQRLLTAVKIRDVPDVVVIFISKFDMFKKGKMFYKVDRILSGLGDVVYNGMSEYSSWKRTRNKKHQILTYAGLI